jgi:predicted nucleotidyltransferase
LEYEPVDLSSPLATVAPTLDAGVLQVLAATTAGCTAGEVHRRLGHGSDEGVRKVLIRLVHQGVVDVATTGRYPVYSLNRDHIAVPHIEALTRVRDEFLRRIRDEVASWKIAPTHVGLFGSFARGTADSSSDVDVLLVRPQVLTDADEASWLEQVDRLDRQIQQWTGNAAQIIDVTPDVLVQMAANADPLVDSLQADDISVHGEPILDLLRRLR